MGGESKRLPMPPHHADVDTTLAPASSGSRGYGIVGNSIVRGDE